MKNTVLDSVLRLIDKPQIGTFQNGGFHFFYVIAVLNNSQCVSTLLIKFIKTMSLLKKMHFYITCN